MSVTNPNRSPVSGVLDSFADLFSDLIDIVELQIRLGREDTKIAFRSSIIPAITLMVALPVLGFALAKLVQDQFKISEWLSHLLVGAAMIVIAMMMVGIAFHMLKVAIRVFKRSASELSNNVRWLKSVIRRDLTDDADPHRDNAL